MRILIIRLSAIGDVFFGTSLLRGLKNRYPDCRITWLTEPAGGTILKGHPLLDRLLVLPRRPWTEDLKAGRWIRLARELREFLGALRAEPFDLVIDPQGLLKSAIWGRLAPADRRIGVGGRDGSSLLYDETIRIPEPEFRPFLSEYRVLLELLGADAQDVRMALHIPDVDQAEADRFLEEQQAPSPLVCCPFTTRPQKHWFAECWARLADLWQDKGLGPVVLLGGPGDGEAAGAIAAQCRHPLVLAAGEARSLRFALGLLNRARAVAGVDTGLTHAGIGLGRPTIALFGSTRPYLDTRTPLARVLYHRLECSPCKRHPTCDGRYDCMRLHTPESVLEALQAVMRAAPDPPAGSHTGAGTGRPA